ncbi:MAG: ComF family protein [Bacteroidia bacterium]|nr:ComF family protein [Bacteroidia bacterium]
MFFKKLLSIINDFFGLIYPNLCEVCGNKLMKHEHVICSVCLYELPRTNFHNDSENPVNQLFWGKVWIENATAFFWFLKGSKYLHIIHNLKYQGKKDIGIELGKHFGYELSGNEKFRAVDVIVPVPLHPKREKKRGYNQAEMIAMGLAESMKIKVDSKTLYRAVYNVTQTKKTKDERWSNVSSIFNIHNKDELKNKHILLVDDVITTGSALSLSKCS